MTRPLPVLLNYAATALLALNSASYAQETATATVEYATERDVPYREEANATEYMHQRCRLDVYHPANARGFSTIVWFHGGGLVAGKKQIPDALREQNVAVVSVNYRLSPQVKSPAWIEDAAAAVAWTFHNIERFGGSADRIFVSGHSAGGYLTGMIGLDKRWLAAHDIDANHIAGLIPYSGHMITHFTVRLEHGIPREQAVVDDLAPLYHVRKDAPPVLLITGDRDIEMLGRYEENAYMWRMMQVVGHPDTELFELEGYNHGQMPEPAHPLLLNFVRNREKR